MSREPNPPLPSDQPMSAFTRRFLARLAPREDPATSRDAETEGPWDYAAAGRAFHVLRAWESPATGSPALALLPDRCGALLLIAAATARERAAPHSLADGRQEAGWPVLVPGSADPSPVAWLASFDPDLVQALALCDGLARSPWALASLLEAAGPTALELTGRLLDQRTRHEARTAAGSAPSRSVPEPELPPIQDPDEESSDEPS